MPKRLSEFKADLKQVVEDKEFRTRQEAQAFFDEYLIRRNSTPMEEFQGLSPDQMQGMLDFPFGSPGLVMFAAVLSIQPQAPILTLFKLLIDAIGEDGLKPTATGNLPRKFVREAALAYWSEAEHRDRTQFGDLRTEIDFDELNVTRLVAELAGLVRKYKGKFIVSRLCRKLLKDYGMAGIYPLVLHAFVEQYNWGYWDHYPDIDFIQHSFLYTLFLLTRFGDEWRSREFYEDEYLKAFPSVLREIAPHPYGGPEEIVRNCYASRCLERFAGFLGLAEIMPDSDDYFERGFKLRKLPLLNEAVIFHI